MGVIKLSPQSLYIAAHRELVYQMVTAIGKGKLPGSSMSSKLISKNEDTIVAEFYTKVGLVTVTTREEMKLEKPERIRYRWLKGPVKHVREEIVFNETDNGGCELAHSGEFDLKIPLLGWLVGRLYIKRQFEKIVIDHMVEIKEAAEARAARSHLYPRPT